MSVKTFKLPIMKSLLPFLLLLVSSATLAESGAYRVEVIVFRDLAVATEATKVQELRSYSQFPSLEEPRLTEELPEEPADGLPKELPDDLAETLHTDQPDDLAETLRTDQPDDLAETLRTDLPDDLHVITQKSTRMEGVWRRLESSGDYQPLVYAAWEQNRIDYYPPMRIHDQKIIATQLHPPTAAMAADLAAQDPLAAHRSTFYQLDGVVQLRRSRFLHLFLDLEYREDEPAPETGPVFFDMSDPETVSAFFDLSEPDPDIEKRLENTVQRTVFKLKQNRQIRTDEMQYFDTPYLGALVFVSAISASQELPEPN